MRHSTVDWPAILDRFNESGVSQTLFCEQNGISLSSFNYWMKKRRDGGGQNGKVAEPRFVELEFTSSSTKRLDAGKDDLVVELPLGVVLRFRGVGR